VPWRRFMPAGKRFIPVQSLHFDNLTVGISCLDNLGRSARLEQSRVVRIRTTKLTYDPVQPFAVASREPGAPTRCKPWRVKARASMEGARASSSVRTPSGMSVIFLRVGPFVLRAFILPACTLRPQHTGQARPVAASTGAGLSMPRLTTRRPMQRLRMRLRRAGFVDRSEASHSLCLRDDGRAGSRPGPVLEARSDGAGKTETGDPRAGADNCCQCLNARN